MILTDFVDETNTPTRINDTELRTTLLYSTRFIGNIPAEAVIRSLLPKSAEWYVRFTGSDSSSDLTNNLLRFSSVES